MPVLGKTDSLDESWFIGWGPLAPLITTSVEWLGGYLVVDDCYKLIYYFTLLY